MSSGASITDSYNRVSSRVFLVPLRTYLMERSSGISHGISLASVFSTINHIPAYVCPLVSAGEASGTLGSSLLRAADIIDRDIENSLKRLTSLIEPIMMVGIGGVVGAIALSIMMPIYDVTRVLQH